MIGLVLALIVAAILIAFFGGWIVAIPVAVAGVVVFVLHLRGVRRRPSEPGP